VQEDGVELFASSITFFFLGQVFTSSSLILSFVLFKKFAVLAFRVGLQECTLHRDVRTISLQFNLSVV